MADTVTLHAVGDVFPIKDNPDESFALCASDLKSADITFCQLEKVLTTREKSVYYNAVVNNPNEIARALANAGFNVVGVGSNHHMDAGVGPFLDTLEVLREYGMAPLGVGNNIVEARTPIIVEQNGVRVAFLGYSSVIPRAEVPYEATSTRPGCTPMFISTFFEQTDWQPGTPPKIITIADKGDLAAMEEDVRKAKSMADIVVMSIHWGVHHLPAVIAMYEYEVGHAAIDAGADLVLGHHAHLLKGIEVYKGKAIFHCLGNWTGNKSDHTSPDVRTRWSSLTPQFVWEDGWEKYSFPPDYRKTMMVKCAFSRSGVER